MSSKWSVRFLGVLLSLLLAAAVGCGGDDEEEPAAGGQAGQQEEPTPVKLAYLAVASDAAMVLGDKQGFFEEEGIDLQLEPVGAGGAAVIPALLKGEYDVASGGIDGPILAAAKGIDVKILASEGAPVSKGHTHEAGTERGTSGIVVPADSDIRSFADLSGKRMAAITVSGLQYLCIAGTLEKAGVDPKSAKVLEVPPPEMLTALESGRVDAATVVEPFLTQAESQGDRNLGDPCIEAMPGAQQAGFYTSGKWAEENAELVAALARALTRSNEYANEHPDEVRAVIPEYTEIPAEVAKEITLTPWDTSGESTLDTVADRLVKYDLLEEKPDTSGLLTEG
jgi:NitT/TauT family transport system substrate-binding protein